MPTINKKQIKPKKVPYRNEIKEDNAAFYGSTAWHRLRNTYLSLHPLCECCVQHNTVTAAEHVHHKRIWNRGNEEERWKWFLDEHNLMSLCTACHTRMHMKAKDNNMNYIDDLTEKEYREAHEVHYIE